ncbi:MAG: hypothetical protein H6R45_1159 [Proteobacteria bacterium]|nr:hypothetical protein [Pseudomonadota bacterium]
MASVPPERPDEIEPAAPPEKTPPVPEPFVPEPPETVPPEPDIDEPDRGPEEFPAPEDSFSGTDFSCDVPEFPG